ncbi:MAG: hypothetical protein HUJ30_03285 [Gammaproteobacteria bacterium]|nr:hypothetical protein [Gammaproteobacteria bacterium]
MKKISFIIISLLIISGCSDIDSENIDTAGICTDFRVSNSGSNAKIEATLTAGCGAMDGSYVDLSPGDTLIAKYLSNSYTLAKHTDALNKTTYIANLNNYTAGESVVIGLHRDDPNDIDALNSYVTLPNAFSVTAPVANQSVTRGQSLTVNWNNTNTSDIKTVISCNSGHKSATYTRHLNNIAPSQAISFIHPTDLDFTPEHCQAYIDFSQSNAGIADPAYELGSKITASYKNRVYVNLNF